MVFYDGEFLCVQLGTKNYKVVLELAKNTEYETQYLPDVGIYCLPPTRKIAQKLHEANFPFDETAKIFLKEKSTKKESIAHDEEIQDEDFQKLYPFQKEGVKTLLSSNKNYLLADEMGLGKSVQGAMYLKLKEGSLPAVIVCPASLKLNWSREIEKWTKVKTYVIEGRTPENLSDEFVKKYPVWIINYDVLGVEDKKEKEEEKKRQLKCRQSGLHYRKKTLEVFGWVDEINKHNFNTIICDEVQYIAEPDTIRSRGVQKICDNDAKKIFLSGTPYETKTSQFFTCLNILNKKLFPNRWQFLMRYCGAVKTFFGWQFKGLTNGEELHEKISTLMIRRLKKDVLTQLPPKNRIVVPMSVTSQERKMYDDVDKELEDAVENKETNVLTKLAKLKQVSIKAKFNSITQWIDDYLSVNDKLVVFVYHKETFDLMMNKYSKICVGINGGTPNKDRQLQVDRFQNDEKVKLFIGQIKSCNAGLTLTKASATCFIEFGNTCVMHAQAEDRVHRIGQTADSVFAYYLVLENSIDMDIMETLNDHNKDIKKVMDNVDEEMFQAEEDMNESILKKYKTRKHIQK